ncbi:MAG: 3-phosphoglycerate dehydrogenase family protein [Atopobiaceae bacterium]|jgi:D-3-phosphoglycerate dehydrogenase
MRYVRVLDNITRDITKDAPAQLGEGYESTFDLSKAEAIVVRASDIHDLDFPDSLRVVARSGSGVNNIPCDELAKRGVVVFNAPGANSNAVKELVLGMMLANSRKTQDGIAWCQAHKDDPNVVKDAEKAKKAFVGRELIGRKVGVVGLGNIGSKVASCLVELGAQVFGYDPYLSVEHALKVSTKVRMVNNLEELFRESDYITVHVPSKEDTIHMVNEEMLGKLNRGAMLLNYARADIVDEDAVAHALVTGQLSCFCTDFATPKTLAMKNTLITPHMGACTNEAERNCAHMAIQEMKDYLELGIIHNSVNYPDCDLGPCNFDGRIACLHANIPNMLSKITGVVGDAGVNIQRLANEAAGENAYTVLDYTGNVDSSVREKLMAIEGMHRVRNLVGGK